MSSTTIGMEQFLQDCKLSEDTAKLLRDTIFAIVRHQHRLDELWYTTSLRKLASSELMDAARVKFGSSGAEEQLRLATLSAWCEMVYLASMSQSLYIMAFLLDMPDIFPKLPNQSMIKSHDLKPTMIDYHTFLKEDGVHLNRDLGWNSYFSSRDVNVEGEEFKTKVPDQFKDLYLEEIKLAVGPCFASTFPPSDRSFFGTFLKKTYIGMNLVTTLYKKLDPTIHCKNVGRSDLEVVASAVAGAFQCDY